jgi:hypothetical protein
LTEDNHRIRKRGKKEINKKETMKSRRVEERERMDKKNERNGETNKEEKLTRKKK